MKRFINRIRLFLAIHSLKRLRLRNNTAVPDNLIKIWMVKGKEPKVSFFVDRKNIAQFNEILYLFRDKYTDIAVRTVYVQQVEDDIFAGYEKYLKDKFKTSKS